MLLLPLSGDAVKLIGLKQNWSMQLFAKIDETILLHQILEYEFFLVLATSFLATWRYLR